jgi:hypothetical protein
MFGGIMILFMFLFCFGQSYDLPELDPILVKLNRQKLGHEVKAAASLGAPFLMAAGMAATSEHFHGGSMSSREAFPTVFLGSAALTLGACNAIVEMRKRKKVQDKILEYK